MCLCVFLVVYTRDYNIFLPRNRFSSRFEALAPSSMFAWVIMGKYTLHAHNQTRTHSGESGRWSNALTPLESGFHLNIWGWSGDASEGCLNERASHCAAHWAGFIQRTVTVSVITVTEYGNLYLKGFDAFQCIDPNCLGQILFCNFPKTHTWTASASNRPAPWCLLPTWASCSHDSAHVFLFVV